MWPRHVFAVPGGPASVTPRPPPVVICRPSQRLANSEPITSLNVLARYVTSKHIVRPCGITSICYNCIHGKQVVPTSAAARDAGPTRGGNRRIRSPTKQCCLDDRSD